MKKDGYLNFGSTDTKCPYVRKQLTFSEQQIKQIQSRSRCLGKLYIPFCTELYAFHEMNMNKLHIYTGSVFKPPTSKKMKTCTSDIFAYQALQVGRQEYSDNRERSFSASTSVFPKRHQFLIDLCLALTSRW